MPAETTKTWSECEIGDLTTETELRYNLGKFYRLGESQFCDMPTATFQFAEDVARELSFTEMLKVDMQPAVWRRIE
jgi:hypothetical protein